MNRLVIFAGITIVILLAAITLLLLPGKTSAPTGVPTATSTPADPRADLIVVDFPKLGAKVSSVLTITGKARGVWYFEASFPVELRTASGALILQHYAQAQGEWMTEEFVPFSSTITFPPQPAGSTGTLILRKDNPSGLPEHDDHIEIPVVF